MSFQIFAVHLNPNWCIPAVWSYKAYIWSLPYIKHHTTIQIKCNLSTLSFFKELQDISGWTQHLQTFTDFYDVAVIKPASYRVYIQNIRMINFTKIYICGHALCGTTKELKVKEKVKTGDPVRLQKQSSRTNGTYCYDSRRGSPGQHQSNTHTRKHTRLLSVKRHWAASHTSRPRNKLNSSDQDDHSS